MAKPVTFKPGAKLDRSQVVDMRAQGTPMDYLHFEDGTSGFVPSRKPGGIDPGRRVNTNGDPTSVPQHIPRLPRNSPGNGGRVGEAPARGGVGGGVVSRKGAAKGDPLAAYLKKTKANRSA